MMHTFDVEVAQKYGIKSAILINNFGYWIKFNEANGVNYFDGRTWTFCSIIALAELFPYMSKREINYEIKKLIDAGILMSGNYNKWKYDRTLWYALTDFGKCIFQNCKMDLPKLSNPFSNIVKPIPDINEDIKERIYKKEKNQEANVTDVTAPQEEKQNSSRFIHPSVEEIKKYVEEKNYGINAENFYNYYQANGWKVGKSQMKDWKAAVRLWESRDKNSAAPKNEEPALYRNSDIGEYDDKI